MYQNAQILRLNLKTCKQIPEHTSEKPNKIVNLYSTLHESADNKITDTRQNRQTE